MILGNLGKFIEAALYRAAPFPYVIREKIAKFPVFSLFIREFAPFWKPYFAHLNIRIENRYKQTFENKRFSLFDGTEKLSFRRRSNSNRVAASGHHPIYFPVEPSAGFFNCILAYLSPASVGDFLFREKRNSAYTDWVRAKQAKEKA